MKQLSAEMAEFCDRIRRPDGSIPIRMDFDVHLDCITGRLTCVRCGNEARPGEHMDGCTEYERLMHAARLAYSAWEEQRGKEVGEP